MSSRIFLKLENLQPSGSFKSRNIGNFLLQAIKQHQASGDTRPLHFHGSSGGNAGLACVTAANMLGCKATIAVPKSTEESMVARLRVAGAQDPVHVHGSNWFKCDEYLRKVVMPHAEESGERAIYVPPFDHPHVWDGAETMIVEIADDMHGEQPDAVVCSVGGGGLFCGIVQGIEREGWSTQVIAVETYGADSLAQAVEKKELVALPEITSVATSLGAPIVAQRALDYALQDNVTTIRVEDAEACISCSKFADDERILVEPACGATISLAYEGRLAKHLKGFGRDSKVVLIVCGGVRTSLKMMDDYKKRFGARATELGMTWPGDIPSTHTA